MPMNQRRHGLPRFGARDDNRALRPDHARLPVSRKESNEEHRSNRQEETTWRRRMPQMSPVAIRGNWAGCTLESDPLRETNFGVRLSAPLPETSMAVDNPDVVDAIGIEQASGVVALTISDHLEWGDGSHLVALQQKINQYLAFLENGQLLEEYPNAVGKPVRIDVVCKHQPDEGAERFLNQARDVIETAGLSFSWRVLDVGST
jgi:hypothetical protein